MSTVCIRKKLEFQRFRRRRVEADFDGGHITGFGGALVLRLIENIKCIMTRLEACFVDERDPRRTEFTLKQLLTQRIYAIILGHEDVNDHDRLRHDPLLALLVEADDLEGLSRRRKRDHGVPLASASTIHRLEHCADGVTKTNRHYKIKHLADELDRLLITLFMEAYREPPKEIILDLDATDDIIHGNQEGRYFHGYYDNYCYLPLYIFCGDFPLCARLRPSNIDACDGCVEELDAIVDQIREQWPKTRIVIRADGGFAREEIFTWCEENDVDYVIGLPRNQRLEKMLEPSFEALQVSGEKRSYHDLIYQTLNSWSHPRRVVAKAEQLSTKRNPRYVVTSFSTDRHDATTLYQDIYCARGEMENRIKEQQLGLFADRTSTANLRSNQLRLYFSTFAYVFMSELRRLGLAKTEMARAHAGTIRNRLLRIGARVYISARRIRCSFATGYVDQDLFRQVHASLRGPPTFL